MMGAMSDDEKTAFTDVTYPKFAQRLMIQHGLDKKYGMCRTSESSPFFPRMEPLLRRRLVDAVHHSTPQRVAHRLAFRIAPVPL